MKFLGMKNGIYNVESCVGKDENSYIMEVSTRRDSCKTADIQEMTMMAELIENEIRSLLGIGHLKFNIHPANGHWCETISQIAPEY